MASTHESMGPFKRALLLIPLLALTAGSARATNDLPGVIQVSALYKGIVAGLTKAIAYDGSNYLVAVQSATSNLIAAQFLAATGSPTGALINLGGVGSLPLVSFDGTNYLIVWAQTNDSPSAIYGQFLSRQGAIVGSPLVISPDANAAEVGGIQFDGINYLVVWEANSANTNVVPNIQGQFVSPSGLLRGGGIQISADSESGRLPALSFDGVNYLVGWMAQVNGTNLWNVQGRFLRTDGILQEPFTISQTPALSANPVALAFGRTNYLAVWSREVGPYVHHNFCDPYEYALHTNYWLMVQARLFSRSALSMGPEFQIIHARGPQTHPAAVFDGDNFLVTWVDKRHGDHGDPKCYPYPVWLYAQQIGQGGEMDEPEFHTRAVPSDAGSALIFAGGQYLSVWNWEWPPPAVFVTVMRHEITHPPALANLTRISSNRSQCDLIGVTSQPSFLSHRCSIEVSTNLLDWTMLRMDGDARLVWPGTLSWDNPFPSGTPTFYRANDGSATCIRNLRRLQAAKDRWALEHDGFNEDMPLAPQLVGPGKYLSAIPVCPNGGWYQWEIVGYYPSCSWGYGYPDHQFQTWIP